MKQRVAGVGAIAPHGRIGGSQKKQRVCGVGQPPGAIAAAFMFPAARKSSGGQTKQNVAGV
ncbi:MAG TPA: hypothetical protein VF111_13045, partial [Thermoanaerobaculia bacterium]